MKFLVKTRRLNDHLTFIMVFPILVRQCLYIESTHSCSRLKSRSTTIVPSVLCTFPAFFVWILTLCKLCRLCELTNVILTDYTMRPPVEDLLSFKNNVKHCDVEKSSQKIPFWHHLFSIRIYNIRFGQSRHPNDIFACQLQPLGCWWIEPNERLFFLKIFVNLHNIIYLWLHSVTGVYK